MLHIKFVLPWYLPGHLIAGLQGGSVATPLPQRKFWQGEFLGFEWGGCPDCWWELMHAQCGLWLSLYWTSTQVFCADLHCLAAWGAPQAPGPLDTPLEPPLPHTLLTRTNVQYIKVRKGHLCMYRWTIQGVEDSESYWLLGLHRITES
jgi:hypothetical protein